jgi:hypothetical protein
VKGEVAPVEGDAERVITRWPPRPGEIVPVLSASAAMNVLFHAVASSSGRNSPKPKWDE